jgi:hypothetical protein
MRSVQVSILAPLMLITVASLTGCPEDDKTSDHAGLDGGVSGNGQDDKDGGPGSVVMCKVSLPTSCPSPKPHYSDVQPIFQQRCVICHDGATADSPWPLTEYEHVADWYDMIRSEVVNCTMPPADAGVPMTDDERMKILTWIRCGFPE